MLQPLTEFVVLSAASLSAASLEKVRAFLQDKKQQLAVFKDPYQTNAYPTPSSYKTPNLQENVILQSPGGN